MAGTTVRASDLGNALAKLFADSRENRAARTREQLSGARSASGNLLAVGPGALPAMPTIATSFVGNAGDTNGPSVVTGPLARARSGDWRTALALGVLAFSVVALASAIVVTMRWSGDRPADAARATPPPAELVGVPVNTVAPPSPPPETAAAVVTPPPSAVPPPPPSPATAAPARPAGRPARGGNGAAPADPRAPKRTIDTSFPK
jgi:hypothetical protein